MKYSLYYAGYNKDTLLEQVGIAESEDFKEWKFLNNDPIIPVGKQGEFDDSQTSNPCVIKHNGVFKMWYQGKAKNGQISICYAESKDNINWNFLDKPINFIKKQITPGYREGFHHPHVIFDENRNIFKMWCVLYEKGMTSFIYTESVNGINWNEIIKTNIFSPSIEKKYWYPFVLNEGEKFVMWFTERLSNKIWRIQRAVSQDGIFWDYDVNLPVINKTKNIIFIFIAEIFAKFFNYYIENPIYGIGSPFVWKEKDLYFLIGHEVGPRGKLYISKYESVDGINWKVVNRNILPKPNSEWNNFFQADPYLYVEK